MQPLQCHITALQLGWLLISKVSIGIEYNTFIILFLLIQIQSLLYRSLWSMRNYIHINLCLSLMASHLVFVVGVDKTSNEVHAYCL